MQFITKARAAGFVDDRIHLKALRAGVTLAAPYLLLIAKFLTLFFFGFAAHN
jgi:hypothetical protein